MYNCTGCTSIVEEGTPCGINELVGGDIVRLVMRCLREENEYTHRVSVSFMLRRLDLVVAMPRLLDVKF